MSDKGGRSCRRYDRGRRSQLRRKCDRNKAFGRIHKQCQRSFSLAQNPGDIGGTDVSAAAFSDIDPGSRSENIARRHRSQEISEHDDNYFHGKSRPLSS